MTKSSDVLKMLCPGVEYVCRGETYEDIDWLAKKAAITKSQFEAGFAQYDAWKTEQDTSKAAVKAELLARLGITAEEAQILLS